MIQSRFLALVCFCDPEFGMLLILFSIEYEERMIRNAVHTELDEAIESTTNPLLEEQEKNE